MPRRRNSIYLLTERKGCPYRDGDLDDNDIQCLSAIDLRYIHQLRAKHVPWKQKGTRNVAMIL